MKSYSTSRLLINISVASVLLILLTIIFFYVVLPWITNRNKIVIVPDLTRLSLEEAKRILDKSELDFEIVDSSYRFEVKPLTVVEQFPKPMSRVKIQRKIEIILNPKIAPLVSYPDLTGSSYDLALTQLRSLELKIGDISYQQDIAHNSILESTVDGSVVGQGQLIPKGTTVNLVVGQDSLKLK